MEAFSEAIEVTARSPTNAANYASGNDMPPDMRFGEAQIITILVISLLFVVSALLNLKVLSNLLAARRTVGLSRPNTLILQLVLADLLVRMCDSCDTHRDRLIRGPRFCENEGKK